MDYPPLLSERTIGREGGASGARRRLAFQGRTLAGAARRLRAVPAWQGSSPGTARVRPGQRAQVSAGAPSSGRTSERWMRALPRNLFWSSRTPWTKGASAWIVTIDGSRSWEPAARRAGTAPRRLQSFNQGMAVFVDHEAVMAWKRKRRGHPAEARSWPAWEAACAGGSSLFKRTTRASAQRS